MDMPLPLAFAVQQGINTVLRLDPHTKQALSGINGKVLRVDVTEPKMVFHLIVVDGEIDVEGSFDAEPDTTITGSASALISLRNANDALYTGAVKISGELAAGEQVRGILSNIEIDFEEVIAPITGDAIAHQIGQIGAQLGAWIGDTHQSLKRNTSEYLQEESEIVAPNRQVARYCHEVDDIREQADRLDARISALEKSRSKT